MLNDRYDIRWVGRCQFQSNTEKSDKVWGWFYYNDPTLTDSGESRSGQISRQPWAYVFWGATSKTLRFKRHPNNTWNMNKLVRTKTEKKYISITVDDLNKFWPNLYDTINEKFIFHLLANDI